METSYQFFIRRCIFQLLFFNSAMGCFARKTRHSTVCAKSMFGCSTAVVVLQLWVVSIASLAIRTRAELVNQYCLPADYLVTTGLSQLPICCYTASSPDCDVLFPAPGDLYDACQLDPALFRGTRDLRTFCQQNPSCFHERLDKRAAIPSPLVGVSPSVEDDTNRTKVVVCGGQSLPFVYQFDESARACHYSLNYSSARVDVVIRELPASFLWAYESQFDHLDDPNFEFHFHGRIDAGLVRKLTCSDIIELTKADSDVTDDAFFVCHFPFEESYRVNVTNITQYQVSSSNIMNRGLYREFCVPIARFTTTCGLSDEFVIDCVLRASEPEPSYDCDAVSNSRALVLGCHNVPAALLAPIQAGGSDTAACIALRDSSYCSADCKFPYRATGSRFCDILPTNVHMDILCFGQRVECDAIFGDTNDTHTYRCLYNAGELRMDCTFPAYRVTPIRWLQHWHEFSRQQANLTTYFGDEGNLVALLAATDVLQQADPSTQVHQRTEGLLREWWFAYADHSNVEGWYVNGSTPEIVQEAVFEGALRAHRSYMVSTCVGVDTFRCSKGAVGLLSVDSYCTSPTPASCGVLQNFSLPSFSFRCSDANHDVQCQSYKYTSELDCTYVCRVRNDDLELQAFPVSARDIFYPSYRAEGGPPVTADFQTIFTGDSDVLQGCAIVGARAGAASSGTLGLQENITTALEQSVVPKNLLRCQPPFELDFFEICVPSRFQSHYEFICSGFLVVCTRDRRDQTTYNCTSAGADVENLILNVSGVTADMVDAAGVPGAEPYSASDVCLRLRDFATGAYAPPGLVPAPRGAFFCNTQGNFTTSPTTFCERVFDPREFSDEVMACLDPVPGMNAMRCTIVESEASFLGNVTAGCLSGAPYVPFVPDANHPDPMGVVVNCNNGLSSSQRTARIEQYLAGTLGYVYRVDCAIAPSTPATTIVTSELLVEVRCRNVNAATFYKAFVQQGKSDAEKCMFVYSSCAPFAPIKLDSVYESETALTPRGITGARVRDITFAYRNETNDIFICDRRLWNRNTFDDRPDAAVNASYARGLFCNRPPEPPPRQRNVTCDVTTVTNNATGEVRLVYPQHNITCRAATSAEDGSRLQQRDLCTTEDPFLQLECNIPFRSVHDQADRDVCSEIRRRCYDLGAAAPTCTPALQAECPLPVVPVFVCSKPGKTCDGYLCAVERKPVPAPNRRRLLLHEAGGAPHVAKYIHFGSSRVRIVHREQEEGAGRELPSGHCRVPGLQSVQLATEWAASSSARALLATQPTNFAELCEFEADLVLLTCDALDIACIPHITPVQSAIQVEYVCSASQPEGYFSCVVPISAIQKPSQDFTCATLYDYCRYSGNLLCGVGNLDGQGPSTPLIGTTDAPFCGGEDVGGGIAFICSGLVVECVRGADQNFLECDAASGSYFEFPAPCVVDRKDLQSNATRCNTIWGTCPHLCQGEWTDADASEVSATGHFCNSYFTYNYRFKCGGHAIQCQPSNLFVDGQLVVSPALANITRDGLPLTDDELIMLINGELGFLNGTNYQDLEGGIIELTSSSTLRENGRMLCSLAPDDEGNLSRDKIAVSCDVPSRAVDIGADITSNAESTAVMCIALRNTCLGGGGTFQCISPFVETEDEPFCTVRATSVQPPSTCDCGMWWSVNEGSGRVPAALRTANFEPDPFLAHGQGVTGMGATIWPSSAIDLRCNQATDDTTAGFGQLLATYKSVFVDDRTAMFIANHKRNNNQEEPAPALIVLFRRNAELLWDSEEQVRPELAFWCASLASREPVCATSEGRFLPPCFREPLTCAKRGYQRFRPTGRFESDYEAPSSATPWRRFWCMTADGRPTCAIRPGMRLPLCTVECPNGFVKTTFGASTEYCLTRDFLKLHRDVTDLSAPPFVPVHATGPPTRGEMCVLGRAGPPEPLRKLPREAYRTDEEFRTDAALEWAAFSGMRYSCPNGTSAMDCVNPASTTCCVDVGQERFRSNADRELFANESSTWPICPVNAIQAFTVFPLQVDNPGDDAATLQSVYTQFRAMCQQQFHCHGYVLTEDRFTYTPVGRDTTSRIQRGVYFLSRLPTNSRDRLLPFRNAEFFDDDFETVYHMHTTRRSEINVLGVSLVPDSFESTNRRADSFLLERQFGYRCPDVRLNWLYYLQEVPAAIRSRILARVIRWLDQHNDMNQFTTLIGAVRTADYDFIFRATQPIPPIDLEQELCLSVAEDAPSDDFVVAPTTYVTTLCDLGDPDPSKYEGHHGQWEFIRHRVPVFSTRVDTAGRRPGEVLQEYNVFGVDGSSTGPAYPYVGVLKGNTDPDSQDVWHLHDMDVPPGTRHVRYELLRQAMAYFTKLQFDVEGHRHYRQYDRLAPNGDCQLDTPLFASDPGDCSRGLCDRPASPEFTWPSRDSIVRIPDETVQRELATRAPVQDMHYIPCSGNGWCESRFELPGTCSCNAEFRSSVRMDKSILLQSFNELVVPRTFQDRACAIDIRAECTDYDRSITSPCSDNGVCVVGRSGSGRQRGECICGAFPNNCDERHPRTCEQTRFDPTTGLDAPKYPKFLANGFEGSLCETPVRGCRNKEVYDRPTQADFQVFDSYGCEVGRFNTRVQEKPGTCVQQTASVAGDPVWGCECAQGRYGRLCQYPTLAGKCFAASLEDGSVLQVPTIVRDPGCTWIMDSGVFDRIDAIPVGTLTPHSFNASDDISCYGRACSGHGRCEHPRFDDPYFEIAPRDSIELDAWRDTLRANQLAQYCVCDEGFTGEFCEVQTCAQSCSPGICGPDSQCICPHTSDGYPLTGAPSSEHSPCSGLICNGRGILRRGKDLLSGPVWTCECDEGRATSFGPRTQNGSWICDQSCDLGTVDAYGICTCRYQRAVVDCEELRSILDGASATPSTTPSSSRSTSRTRTGAPTHSSSTTYSSTPSGSESGVRVISQSASASGVVSRTVSSSASSSRSLSMSTLRGDGEVELVYGLVAAVGLTVAAATVFLAVCSRGAARAHMYSRVQ